MGDSGLGNGWVAFGEGDSQEYVNDAKNMEVVDFNTLANVEPTVLNVFYMPYGTELEFKEDQSGKYFVNVKTGEEIREPVKNPLQLAFEKNLKFLNKEQYPKEFFTGLFRKGKYIRPFVMGEADFSSGKIVIADPLAYLGNEKYSFYLSRSIPAGVYPVELSILCSPIAGIRTAAARLVVSGKETVRYEIAMPFGTGSIRGKTIMTIILRNCSAKAMKNILMSRERAEIFWYGNCRKAAAASPCFPAEWGMASIPLTGDWTQRRR